jgi:hypothetical protein
MNKFEKFAVTISKKLFDMRVEDLKSDVLVIHDQDIPKRFIDGIVYNASHANAIKERLKVVLFGQVLQYPSQFKIRHFGFAQTSRYVYSPENYMYSYLVDAYIKEQFEATLMKTVFVCDTCGSDNVQSKAWVRPNQGNAFVDLITEDVQDNFCDDCNENVLTSSVEKPHSAQVLGFQVVDACNTLLCHPHMKFPNCVYSLDQANSMLDDDNNGDEQWQLLAIWTQDLADPEIMFDCEDPRDLKQSS